MAQYVDGFLIVIKKANLKAYKKDATLGQKVWLEHGALQYFECQGDDLNVKWGLPFPKLCKLRPDETIMFSFVIYASKAERKRVNALVMKDPRMNKPANKMPFDLKRFSVGGFNVWPLGAKTAKAKTKKKAKKKT